MAGPYDIVTLNDTKLVLGIALTNTVKDVALSRLISTVSDRLDSHIGPTIARSVTSERYDGGLDTIELRRSPAITISSVIEYQDTRPVYLAEEQPGIQPTEAWYGDRYTPEPSLYSGLLHRRLGSERYRFWSGRGNVVISYTAGRSTTTATVNPRIQEATFLCLRNMWRSYEQSVGPMSEFDVPAQSFPTFAIPKVVRQLLPDMYQSEVGFG